MDNQPTTITKNQHFIIQGKQNTIFNYLNNKIGEKESKIVIYKVLSKKDDVYEIECKKLTSLDDSINNGFIPFHALNIGIEMLKKQIQDTEFMIQELLSRQFSSTTNTSFPTESGLFSDYQIRAIAS